MYRNIENITDVLNTVGPQVESVVRFLGAVDGCSKVGDVAVSGGISLDEAVGVTELLDSLSAEFELEPKMVVGDRVPFTTLSGDTLRFHAEGYGLLDAVKHAVVRQQILYATPNPVVVEERVFDNVTEDLLIRHTSSRVPFSLSDGALLRIMNMAENDGQLTVNRTDYSKYHRFIKNGDGLTEDDWLALGRDTEVAQLLEALFVSDPAQVLRYNLVADEVGVERLSKKQFASDVPQPIKMRTKIIGGVKIT